MKTIIKSVITILFLGSLTWSCQVDGIKDIEQEMPVVLWEKAENTVKIIKEGAVVEIPSVQLRLFGQSLSSDLTVNIEVDAAKTTAVENVHFTISEKSLVLDPGVNLIQVPIEFDTESFTSTDPLDVVLNITTVSGNARNASGATTITIKPRLLNLKLWEGEYTFLADGWDCTTTLSALDNGEQMVMNNFWDNGLDMTATVIESNPESIKFVVAPGTKISDGWDARGVWYLDTELIGVFDLTNRSIEFIQFDYVCDNGEKGSFPWCEETCKLDPK